MPAPRKPHLRHVPVRLRVSVDPETWRATYGERNQTLAEIDADVRGYVLHLVQDSGAVQAKAIISARRDGA